MSAIMLTPIGLLLALATPSPALADLRELERFRGTWVRVERERDDAARFAEIDRVTDSKSLLFRTLARAVMRRRTKPVDHYEVEYDGGIHWIRSNIGELYPLDGRPRAGAEADAVISWVEDGQIHPVLALRPRQPWDCGLASRPFGIPAHDHRAGARLALR